MRATQYRELMENLDAALNNGYEEILEQEPAEIYDEIVEQTGRQFEDVPREEVEHCIAQWQLRKADE